MLEVYTSQFRYSGPDRLDITVKSGDQVFAPTWSMVMDYKKAVISDKEYTVLYQDLMAKSYGKNTRKWEDLLSKNRIVLVCYCRKDAFCHRILLAKMLEKLGAVYKGEI